MTSRKRAKDSPGGKRPGESPVARSLGPGGGLGFKEVKEILASMDEQILLADGFEEALIGYAEIFNRTIALYDREKCIEILVARDGMTHDDALEYFNFNVTGAYVGEKTPGFATILRRPVPVKRGTPVKRDA